jgi:hypothetical protein
MILQGGQYILTLVDFYGANFTVFILGLIEVVGIAWIYGKFLFKLSHTSLKIYSIISKIV